MKGPEEATVAPRMPLVVAQVGSQGLDDVLEDISLSTMVTESSLSSACLKTSDIALAQKPCSANILFISSINASWKIVDSTYVPNGIGTRVRRVMRVMSCMAISHAVSFTSRGILG